MSFEGEEFGSAQSPNPPPRYICRAILEESLYACQSAKAHLAVFDSTGHLQGGVEVVVCDPLGIVDWALPAITDDDDSLYLPALTPCNVVALKDAFGLYEILNAGQLCNQSGSEQSSEESSEESSLSSEESSLSSEESSLSSEESSLSSEQSSPSQPCITTDQVGLGGIKGYKSGTRQFLSHDTSGCLEWIDGEPCQSGSS